MVYVPYVDSKYYENEYKGATLSAEALDKALKEASRRIDTLTYNRIVAKGFENLTLFQQEIIKETVCKLVDFYEENKSQLESYVDSYSINGVSLKFGGTPNLRVENGVYIPTEIYNFLSQTGLTCRRL